ncbi:hypothetical protein PC9H_005593 [Pleurotus ostreatus]|uniref:DUF6534 domain-containing protein n=2 Tax=Pleurotus ostreatus TaxID=5322 RepID=A0A067NP33_PLEO1|nr:uncharacterized protein PC9H_005593 [Pleurotus ostreatus]KAF7433632.1 hypothetical protein PC9H_005593 [Pleurotus ostreatus]KAJ8697619.1 hypothetical protein PTI98_004405 [Pleurotus ostreatus]KDQ28770.1 hypothetical protein PLEOSDRAFT_156509 [Pleurotus ostreatus PC15]
MSNVEAIKNLLSIAEIGSAVSVFLFGVYTVQLYLYYSNFPKDRWQLKALVAVVSVLELGHVISVLHYLYTISISWYDHPERLFVHTPIGISIETLLGGYIACIVQVFFTDRARRLTGAWRTAYFCNLLSLARFALTTAVVIYLITKTLSEFEKNWGWLVTVCLVVGAAVDIIVAGLLCSHLIWERKTSFERTTKLIDRIILMTLQTGLATSMLTLAVMILFETMTDSYVWVALYMCLARIFSNSLLATLNARTVFRRLADGVSLRLDAQTSPTRLKFAHGKASIPIGMSGSPTSQTSQSTSTTFDPPADDEYETRADQARACTESDQHPV